MQGGRLLVRWPRGCEAPIARATVKRFGWRSTKVCRAKRSLVGGSSRALACSRGVLVGTAMQVIARRFDVCDREDVAQRCRE